MNPNQDFSIDIFSLNISKGFVSARTKLENVATEKLSFIAKAFTIYQNYYKEVTGSELDSKIVDVNTFLTLSSTKDIQTIADFLESKTNKEGAPRKIEKEDSTVPVQLETMVDLYQKSKADEIGKEKEFTVADQVQRARKTWLEREKVRLIYQNASEVQQRKAEEEKQRFYRQSVDPKKSYQEITQNSRRVIEIALVSGGYAKSLTQEEKTEAIEKVLYLAETGNLDIDNIKQLYTATTLAASDYLEKATELAKIDKLVQEELKKEELNKYLEDQVEYEAKIAQAEKEIEAKYNLEIKKFTGNILNENEEDETEEENREGKKNNEDNDLIIAEAKKEIDKITNNLSKAVPNPKSIFEEPSELEKHAKELEEAIRKDIGLSAIPSSIGVRTSNIVQITSGDRKISATAVDLYSKGLNTTKLEKALDIPGSYTAQVLAKNRTLNQQIRFQLRELEKKQNSLGAEITQSIRPVSESFSKLSPTAQAILSPYQSAKAYVYKRVGQSIGNSIARNTTSAAAKKLSGYILRKGLKEGVTAFTSEALKKGAMKVVTMAALKLGVSLSAESLNAIAPGLGLVVDVLLQIGIWVIEKTVVWAYNQFKDTFLGKDFSLKETLRDATIAAGALVGGFVVLGNTIRGFSFATRAAIVSAVGIIWLAIATVAVLLSLTFITAPILTTLVQFDSVGKVEYLANTYPDTPVNCANMPWPFDSTHTVTQGPRHKACTHGGEISESADFGTPMGTVIKSMTEGVVIEAIRSNTGYGNHVKVNATTDNGEKFTIIYAHLSVLRVGTGGKVNPGTVIGLSGNTGMSTGPHLHIGYIGIEYNSCPAGGHIINENCCGSITASCCRLGTTCNQP